MPYFEYLLEKAVYRLSSENNVKACRLKAEQEFDKIKAFNSYILLYNRFLCIGGVKADPRSVKCLEQ